VEVTEEIKRLIRPETKTYFDQPASPLDMAVANEAIDKLITEGGGSFYNYVDSRGLSKDPSLIVLSSSHHYYYDFEEINNAKTVVYLKELNRIKEIKSLLYSHLHFLPEKCNFVGCFINNRKIERYTLRKNLIAGKKVRNSDDVELGIVSRFPFINMLYSIMDSKTDAYMSENSVTRMLRVHGFKIMEMKEVNGLTYFHSQKVGAGNN
jgi:uncharacterized protein YlbG (UPF0298 family)